MIAKCVSSSPPSYTIVGHLRLDSWTREAHKSHARQLLHLWEIQYLLDVDGVREMQWSGSSADCQLQHESGLYCSYFCYFASRNSFSILHSTQYYIGFPMILSLFQSTAFAREISPNHFFLWPFRFSLWQFWNRAAFQGYCCCCLMGAMCLLLHSSRAAIQFR